MAGDGVDDVVVAKDEGGVVGPEDRDVVGGLGGGDGLAALGLGGRGIGVGNALAGEEGREGDVGDLKEGVGVSGSGPTEAENGEGVVEAEDVGEFGGEVERGAGFVVGVGGAFTVDVEATSGVGDVDGGEGWEGCRGEVDGLEELTGFAEEGNAGGVFEVAGVLPDD